MQYKYIYIVEFDLVFRKVDIMVYNYFKMDLIEYYIKRNLMD